jgi:hypothetical protein
MEKLSAEEVKDIKDSKIHSIVLNTDEDNDNIHQIPNESHLTNSKYGTDKLVDIMQNEEGIKVNIYL